MATGITAHSSGLLGPLPQVSSGIDFMAFAKGAEAAKDLNWRDQLREQERAKMFKANWQEDLKDTAQAYTSTFMHSLQQAAQAGIPTHEALTMFRDQIMADPYYQQMPIQAQQMVQSRLLDTVRLQADELTRQGRMPETMRLLESFGMSSPFTQVDVAAAHGSPEQFVEAYRRQFPDSQISIDPETGGVIPFPGAPAIPLGQAMQQMAHHKSIGSLYGPLYQMEQQAAQDQQRAQIEEIYRRFTGGAGAAGATAEAAPAGDVGYALGTAPNAPTGGLGLRLPGAEPAPSVAPPAATAAPVVPAPPVAPTAAPAVPTAPVVPAPPVAPVAPVAPAPVADAAAAQQAYRKAEADYMQNYARLQELTDRRKANKGKMSKAVEKALVAEMVKLTQAVSASRAEMRQQSLSMKKLAQQASDEASIQELLR